jgi:hypothetical protein
MRVRTRSDLEKLSADGMSTLYPSRLKISVGMATCGLATGADAVYRALRDEATAGGRADAGPGARPLRPGDA